MLSFVILPLIIAVFYFLVIRPQRKRQKKTEQMITTLRRGDRVTTIGGIRGTVHTVKQDTLLLEVDNQTKMEFAKSAIAECLGDDPRGAPSKGVEISKEKEKTAGTNETSE